MKPWVDSVLGRPIEVEDASNLDQCMDLAFSYLDYLGIPHAAIRHLYAYQVYAQPTVATRQNFTLVPAASLQPGDLVVWGTSVGTAGHIAVFESWNGAKFYSIDQNWDVANHHDAAGNPVAARILHTTNGVLGGLRPINNQGAPEMPTSQQHPDLLTIQLAYNIGLHRQPNDDELKGWENSSTEQLLRTILGSGEHKELQRLAEAGKGAEADVTVLAPGQYRVK